VQKRIILALLALSSLPLHAQDAPPPSTETAESRAGLPLILLFLPDIDPKQKDNPNLLVANALRENIIKSGQYRIIAYRPDNPLVKRAIAEKTLAPSDLAAAEMTSQTRHAIARIFNARFALKVASSKTDDGIKTATTFEQAQGIESWANVFYNDSNTRGMLGRKRLNIKDTALIAADSIAVQMGLPSRLPDPLKWETKGLVPKGTKPPKETAQPKPEKPDPTTAETNPPDANSELSDPQTNLNTQKPEKTVTPLGQNSKVAKPNETLTTPKTQPITKSDAAKPNETKTNLPPTSRPNEAFSAFTTDTADTRPDEPLTTKNDPTQDTSRLDYEAMAIRFRQSGDTANMITSLRRAINERPRDTNLRKLLVQAYQDRRLPDAARLEAERALILAPDDYILHRLHGETLLAEGNVAGAAKAFAEAIRLNPADISSQVALGDTLLADNQYTQAIAAYEAAAKSDPRSSLPHRRLGRVHAAKASSDIKEYTLALTAIDSARGLIAPTDTTTYSEELILLMKMMDSRLNDLLAQLRGSYTARLQGKQTGAELVRTTVDMKERTEAAADFLDKLPSAPGLDMIQARYAQGAAYLLQAMTFFRDYLTNGDNRAEESYKGAQLEAQRELANALKRLNTAITKKK